MQAPHILARLRRPFAVWFAVWIALLGALAPTVSHAVALSRGGAAGVIEICTSSGSRWLLIQSSGTTVAPTDGATDTLFAVDSKTGQESALSLNHCPFCLLSTDRVAPAPHSLVHLFVVLGDSPEPAVRQAFFFSHHHPPGAPPRGPPLVS